MLRPTIGNKVGRTFLVLAIAAVACIAVLTLYIEDDTDDVSETITLGSTPANAHPWHSTDKGIMSALVDLKAYCMSARSKALDMMDDTKDQMLHTSKSSSLIPFVIRFGKKSKQPIVIQYANIMGKLRSHYDRGLGAFLLDSMNNSILKGKHVTYMGFKSTSHDGNWYLLNHHHLGLRTRPQYFRTMAIRLSEYSSNKVKVDSKGNQKAMKKWIESGNSHIYKMFLSKIMASYSHAKQTQASRIQAGAVVAERSAYKEETKKTKDNQKQIMPMPPAGVKGGAFVRKQLGNELLKFPSEKAMVASAKKKALGYITALEKRNMGDKVMIKTIEKKLEGVSIRVKTASGVIGAESTMQPLVEIKGTLGTLRGRINSLPLAGHSITTIFNTDDNSSIGTVERVAFKSSNKRDPWLCASVEVKVGAGKPWLRLKPDGGKTRFWLDTKPYNNGPYYGHPKHHFVKLYADGTAKPSFIKQYSKKWPHCENLSCFYGEMMEFHVKCAEDHRCNGFSFKAGHKTWGDGCLKKNCEPYMEQLKGFGTETHDYYLKKTNLWARVLKMRRRAREELHLKHSVIKETKVKLLARKAKAHKEKAVKGAYVKKANMQEKIAKKNLGKAAAAKEKDSKQAHIKLRAKYERVRKVKAQKDYVRDTTCNIRYFAQRDFQKYLGSVSHFCGTKVFKLKKGDTAKVASFKFSKGCNWVELWDQDKCAQGSRNNRWYSFKKQATKLPWGLHNDVCGLRVNARC